MKKGVKNKSGISAIVATVLIILIVIAGIGILWGAILPLVRNNLDTQEFDVDLSIDTSQGYTVYDSDAGLMSVQVRRGADDVDLAGLAFTITSEGNSVTRIFDDVPESNQARRYDLFLEKGSSVDSIGVAPIYSKGGSSEQGVVLSGVENLAEADLNSVDENGEGKNLYAGLVSYWSFDEGVEDDYGDLGVANESGGEIDCSQTGIRGDSCYFNGSQNLEYVEFNGDYIDEGFTFSLWLLPEFEQDRCYSSSEGYGSGNYGPIVHGNSSTGWNWQARYGFDSNCYLGFHVYSGSPLKAVLSEKLGYGAWKHIVGISNSTHILIYLQGEFISSVFLPGPIESNNNPLLIGQEGWAESYGNYFTGRIDEVGIWNRALTESEVKELYSSY